MRPQPNIGPSGRAAKAADVHYRQFDDELLLLDLAAGHYFALNAVGARMWHALVAGKSPEQVATELAGDYGVDLDVLTRDCVTLADDLLARGLLRRSPS
jgi:hypothetical protein